MQQAIPNSRDCSLTTLLLGPHSMNQKGLLVLNLDAESEPGIIRGGAQIKIDRSSLEQAGREFCIDFEA